MQRVCSVLLQVLMSFVVSLSAAVDPHLATRPSPARAAIADQHSVRAVAPALPSPRAKRKRERRLERRHDREQDRQRDRRQADRDRERARHRDKGRRESNNLSLLCDDRASSRRSGPCTHGPDPAPPGFDVKQDVAPLVPSSAAALAATTVCDGDGQSGFRVHLLYVHASDVPSRYAQYRASIPAWAAEADLIFLQSAALTGGERHIRFVHDRQCLPLIDEVTVSPAGDGSFWTTIDELQSRGYARTDRIYQAFVDANVYCGVGVVWNDDRADGQANRHNIGPSYSRVDSGCWGGAIAAHELMHNLGGVQLSAPHSSGGFHCIDEYDVMCYQDSSRASTLHVACQDPAADWLFDCNHDDYFSTNSAPGSYLATHWNAANNRFLIGAPAAVVASPPPAPVTGSPSSPPGKDGKHKKSKGAGKKGKKGKKGSGPRHRSHSRAVIKAN